MRTARRPSYGASMRCSGSSVRGATVTTPQAGSPVMFLVTPFRFVPASFVYQTSPSSVPALDEAHLDV
jgi:hypothetical protein